MLHALAKNGPRSKAYLQARDQISNELMNIRFAAKQFEALCDSLRKLVERGAQPRARDHGSRA